MDTSRAQTVFQGAVTAGGHVIIASGNVSLGGDTHRRSRSGPIAYNLPNLPQHYQPRVSDLEGLRHKLLAVQNVGIVGMRGMGGIGKTVLATALARDESVQRSFPDGVAWLTFGRTAPVLTKAAELFAAITGEAVRFETVDAARGQLGEATRELALLVVLDDLWDPEASDPFTGLGPRCRVLITTRDARVLTRAQASQHNVGLLCLPTARIFLAAAANLPDAKPWPLEGDAIVSHSGFLPLALAAVGALVKSSVYGWAEILQAFEEGTAEEFDTPWLPDPEQRNVALVLRLSVERLPREAKACFLACAAFREAVEIPEVTLLQLWSGMLPNQRLARRMVEELEARSLLARDEQRRYRIHDLYVDLLRHLAAPLPPRHAYLLTHYREASPAGWATCPDDGYILRHLPWHLLQAGRAEELRGLIFDSAWLSQTLTNFGIYEFIDACQLLPDDTEVQTLAAALTLSAAVLVRDPAQLAHQLHGRLLPDHGPGIASLLDATLVRCQLWPERGLYLAQPGSEVGRFEWHSPTENRLEDIRSISILPDGRRALVALFGDTTVQLWDLSRWKELRRFEQDCNTCSCMTACLDGRRALIADVRIRVWDLDTGAELSCLQGHSGSINSIALLPDNRRALSASDDQTLRLWDINTGDELRRLVGHSDSVNCVAIMPNACHAVSASSDMTVRLWDLNTGAELRRFVGHTDQVNYVAVLADGDRLISASEDRTVRLWSLATGAELRCFGGNRPYRSGCLAPLPDGRRVLSSAWQVAPRLWDLETGTEVRRFEGHSNIVFSVAILPDGEQALSVSLDRTARLWDLRAEKALHPTGLAVALSVAALPDGYRALSASGDGLRMWDLRTGIELRRFEGHSNTVNSVAVLSDGSRALSASSDWTVRLWDVNTGAELRCFGGDLGPLSFVVVLPDERSVLAVSDRAARLWDVNTGTELRRLNLDGALTAISAVVPDGCGLLRSDWRSFWLWDLRTGERLRCFDGHSDRVTAIAVLPDGRRALSGSDDKTLRLWDVETGIELRCFERHLSRISSIAVLPDGHRALSASHDGTLSLWNVETGFELARFVGDSPFWATALIKGDERLVTGNARGQVASFRIRVSDR